MKVKLLHEDAQIPTKANSSDAGFDLYALEQSFVRYGEITVIRTGIALEIPDNCVGIIKDRSSVARNGITALAGVIDSGYRGEILIILSHLDKEDFTFRIVKGQKIAQLLILPLANIPVIQITKELSHSERGEKGFGSSDEPTRKLSRFSSNK